MLKKPSYCNFAYSMMTKSLYWLIMLALLSDRIIVVVKKGLINIDLNKFGVVSIRSSHELLQLTVSILFFFPRIVSRSSLNKFCSIPSPQVGRAQKWFKFYIYTMISKFLHLIFTSLLYITRWWMSRPEWRMMYKTTKSWFTKCGVQSSIDYM